MDYLLLIWKDTQRRESRTWQGYLGFGSCHILSLRGRTAPFSGPRTVRLGRLQVCGTRSFPGFWLAHSELRKVHFFNLRNMWRSPPSCHTSPHAYVVWLPTQLTLEALGSAAGTLCPKSQSLRTSRKFQFFLLSMSNGGDVKMLFFGEGCCVSESWLNHNFLSSLCQNWHLKHVWRLLLMGF